MICIWILYTVILIQVLTDASICCENPEKSTRKPGRNKVAEACLGESDGQNIGTTKWVPRIQWISETFLVEST